jgi:hypothetical protein
MAIVKYPPNTIHLAGNVDIINDVAAGASILPGMLIERYNSSGVPLFRPHGTAAVATSPTFALNQSMLNKGVDDAYASGDLVEAAMGKPGTTFWARLASGQSVVNGQKLESAGTGYLRALAVGTNVPLVEALETVDATAAAKMIRVQVV